MGQNDVILFLANEIIKSVKNGIEFNLEGQLQAIRISNTEDNQKIIFNKSEFTEDEIKRFTIIQEIPTIYVRDFLVREGYIKLTSQNKYILTN